MKITRVIIDNLRCFKHLDLDLTNEGTASDLIILLGNNGVGKSTILRCIALCLCEESSAGGLIAELTNDWVRKESKKNTATIRIEFEKSKNYKSIPYIETTIKNTRFGEYDLNQELYPKVSKFWDEVFVCGYGANRRSYGTTSYNEYTVTDAVYSLFNYNTDMQNIELNMRRIEKEIDVQALFRKIENVLMLEAFSIKLERSGIQIKGPWGSYMPIGTLGDGYQAVLAWIMDMYGWKLLYEDHLTNAEISGIVFLDEIEQHLHPIWQTEIIQRLSNQFPNIQFFISTHSPLVALNSVGNSINELLSKLYVFEWNKNEVLDSLINEPLIDLSYNQMLGSEAFGHLSDKGTAVEDVLFKMSQLASIDQPTKKQVVKLKKIKHELKRIMFPEGATLIERIVERDYHKELEDKADYLKKLLK